MTTAIQTRTGLDELTTQSMAETSAMAMAERQKHIVQARYQVALARPRNVDDVRVQLLKECDRPRFAEAARYNKPIGKGVTGASIRFVECALGLMGNIHREAQTIYDDADKRIIEIVVTDLETNTSHSRTTTVMKRVERKNGKDRQVLGRRKNSYGDELYIVAATDDEILDKEAAQISKAVRQCGLALMPFWLVEEAMDRCIATARKQRGDDPDQARRDMVDAWAKLGVLASDLVTYLGHPIQQMTDPQWDKLEGLYNAIKSGETTWQAAVVARDEIQSPAATKPKADFDGYTAAMIDADVYVALETCRSGEIDGLEQIGRTIMAEYNVGRDDILDQAIAKALE